VNRSLVRHLIVKDFQLHRASIIGSIAAGVLCLVIFQFRGLVGLLGIIGFFTALVVLGSMIPHASVVSERKGQNLAFLMSLPISSIQYTMAKILAALGMFLIPWLTLVISAMTLMLSRSDIPNGVIPVVLILVILPLIGFCAQTSIALVGESEGWVIASTIATNVSYSFAWPLIFSNAELRASATSPTLLWSPIVLKILGLEFVAIAGILAITFDVQARKKDFV
jgi:hypothetical protein